ncbi:MAG TPA: 4Fe-4S binding protein [Terriglobales bacterium]
MAYVITKSCSGKDAACQDACPYGCIQTMPGKKSNGRHYFVIDQETCTDCGACALACPEQAIAYGHEVVHYQKPVESNASVGTMVGSIGGWNGLDEVYVKLSKNEPPKKVKIPEGYVVVGDKLEAWARLMAACGD